LVKRTKFQVGHVITQPKNYMTPLGREQIIILGIIIRNSKRE
jgi:hypothetical protein